ncbi:MAG: lipopolysaccharide heptosyltransferase II [Pyrinomonadaceae bacterium]
MKILVRGNNWIGDAVMSIPALRQIRRIFPDAAVTLLTRSWAVAIFDDVDFIDELVTFDPAKSRLTDVIRNARFLTHDGYDLAILFPNSFEAALTAYLARIPRRIGYNKDLRGLLLTDSVPVPEWKNRRHEVLYYLNLVCEVERRMIGQETVLNSKPDLSLSISDRHLAVAGYLLTDLRRSDGNPVVALGVGSTNSRAKRWPAPSYARLGIRLQTDANATVVLVGSKDEVEVAYEVSKLMPHPPINLVGKTDLVQAMGVLDRVDLLVANDMGLAHIAAALGTKTLTIFGPTNADTTRPFPEGAEVLRANVECSPCMLRNCPIDHRCMTEITVDAVFETAVRLLGV